MAVTEMLCSPFLDVVMLERAGLKRVAGLPLLI